MFRFKFSSTVIHISCWLLFLGPSLLFLSQGEIVDIPRILSSWQYILFCSVFISLFYLNFCVLIPRLFILKRYLLYLLSFIILLGIVITVKPFQRLMFNNIIKKFGHNIQLHPPPFDFKEEQKEHRLTALQDINVDSLLGIKKRLLPPRGSMNIDISSIFIFLIIMAISLACKFIIQWGSSEKRALIAEAEKTNAELSFLKAQINPHFLFNTLNNIYSLSLSESKYTSDSIMKLSNIMHFITDEAGSTFISLQREIEFIRDYIDLQKLRLGKDTKVIFGVEGAVNDQKISPLIFVPFVENAFKYGISKNETSEIIIKILVSNDNISLRSINSIFKSNAISERTGVGINNTKKRLVHLYPQKHQLITRETGNLFIVNLTLYCT